MAIVHYRPAQLVEGALDLFSFWSSLTVTIIHDSHPASLISSAELRLAG